MCYLPAPACRAWQSGASSTPSLFTPSLTVGSHVWRESPMLVSTEAQAARRTSRDNCLRHADSGPCPTLSAHVAVAAANAAVAAVMATAASSVQVGHRHPVGEQILARRHSIMHLFMMPGCYAIHMRTGSSSLAYFPWNFLLHVLAVVSTTCVAQMHCGQELAR